MLTLIMVASLFNSSFQKDLSFSACKQVEVKKSCSLSVDAVGFGSKPFILYSRQSTGELLPLQEEHLDVTGKKTLTIKFAEQGATSIVFVLFDRGKPIAMDGADILVTPDKRQLGQQTDLMFPGDSSSTEEPFQEEVHN